MAEKQTKSTDSSESRYQIRSHFIAISGSTSPVPTKSDEQIPAVETDTAERRSLLVVLELAMQIHRQGQCPSFPQYRR